MRDYRTKNGSPDLTTITIGGNDLGFADILRDCYIGGTEACLAAVHGLDKKVTSGRASLINTLASTYRTVQDTAGPGSAVVVVGYPNLFPAGGGVRTALSVSAHCPYLRETFSLFPLPSPLVDHLLGNISSAQASLNDDMAAASAQAGVNFRPIPDALQGHELCTGSPWINGINPLHAGLINNDRNSGHPNVEGSASIAREVGASIFTATQPTGDLAYAATDDVASRSSIGFTGGALPAGSVGGYYLDYLVATGGAGAQSWSVSSGHLPPGITLDAHDGTLTGRPTKKGSFRAVVKVVSGRSSTSHKVSIRIAAESKLAITTSTVPTATQGQPLSVSLAGTGGYGPLHWSISAGSLPAGLHLNGSSGVIFGTPGKSAVGTTAFTLRASDQSPDPRTATRAEKITVVPSSAALKIVGSLPSATQAGSDYFGQLASNGGVAPTTWSVSSGSLPPGLTLDPASGLLSGDPTQAGTYGVTVTVTDAGTPTSHVASKALSIKISDPAALHESAQPLPAAEGDYYSTTVSATGGVAPYSFNVSAGTLPAGLTLDSASGSISGTPTGTGSSHVTVTTTDSAGAQISHSYTITVSVRHLHVAATLRAATVGSYYAANVTPRGGSAPYYYSVVSGKLPDGLTFDTSTGAIVGTSTQSGSYTFKVGVTDSSQPQQHLTATVKLVVHAAPKLAISAEHTLSSGSVGTSYAVGIGYRGGHPAYTWSITKGALPPGLSLDPVSGEISGTPTEAGRYTPQVKVTDASAPKPEHASAELTISIKPRPALAVGTGALPPAVSGVEYQAFLEASGGTPPYSWSVSSGHLPHGLVLDASSGEITGTPTVAGSSTLTVKVADSVDKKASRSEKIRVYPPSRMSIDTVSLDPATQGASYDADLTVDGGVGTVTWKVVSGALPAGLMLNASGEISGTPTRFGYSTFEVKATDSATPKAHTTTGSETIQVIAEPDSAPQFIDDGPPTSVPEDGTFDYQFSAAGNPAPSFQLASGSLPTGLTLSSAGLLSGTATASGTFTFSITASNGHAPDATTPSITVDVIAPPTVTDVSPGDAVPGTTVVITGTALANAGVDIDGYGATVLTNTDDEIDVQVPEFAEGTAPISVYTPGGSVQTADFTVDPPPTPAITSFDPESAAAGAVVTISGTGLEFAQQVEFNGATVSGFIADSPTQLQVQVPGGIAAGPISVVTDGGSATSTDSFTPSG